MQLEMAHHVLGDKKEKFQKINAKAFLVKFLNVRNEEGTLDNLMEKAGIFQGKDKAGLRLCQWSNGCNYLYY